MAWVLLLLENLGQDKRVESILVPCLDAGSNPAISTKNQIYLVISKKSSTFAANFGKMLLIRGPIAQLVSST